MTEDLLKHATEFQFLPSDTERGDRNASYFTVLVSRRGISQWSVIWMGEVWNGQAFEYEPLNSSELRTEDYLERTRFTLEEAVRIARDLPDQLTVNGKTYTEISSRR